MEHQGTERSTGSRWLAGLLGCLLPGLGQVYNRQFRKGLHVNLLWWGAVWMTLFAVGGLAVAPFNLVLALPWTDVHFAWSPAARNPASLESGVHRGRFTR